MMHQTDSFPSSDVKKHGVMAQPPNALPAKKDSRRKYIPQRDEPHIFRDLINFSW